jgi:hypothetical protein
MKSDIARLAPYIFAYIFLRKTRKPKISAVSWRKRDIFMVGIK